jgi:hypothetical protein
MVTAAMWTEAHVAYTDGSGIICRTTDRTIMFSQVRFPIINRHRRPDPVPMFVRYPRHRPQSVPPASIRAMGRNPGRELSSAPSAAICAEVLTKTQQSRFLR